VDKPDAVYTPEYLTRFGSMYADGAWVQESPVKDLLAFAKEREKAKPADPGNNPVVRAYGGKRPGPGDTLSLYEEAFAS
jgi:hypothetical protein